MRKIVGFFFVSQGVMIMNVVVELCNVSVRICLDSVRDLCM